MTILAARPHFATKKGDPMLTSRRLLIIEDEFLIALDIQRIVEEANAVQTVFARNYAEAAALADHFAEYDLAIVNPPDSTAREIETAARLAAAGPAIVVCTAAKMDVSSTPFAGAETVTKPFADGDLLAACERALKRWR
jgi:DNA-binding response OmpR family regulator